MEFYPGLLLSKASPVDKPWDRHKADNNLVSSLYGENPEYAPYQDRMDQCAPWLLFGEVSPEEAAEHDRKLKLEKAHFCRVRLCPVCAWRKSLALKARFYANWDDGFKEACEGYAYIHLVLTVMNPPMDQLRETIKTMNGAFKKLLKRKEVIPVCKGYIKSIEITRGKDGNPHPHIHATIAVNLSYFSDRTYISQKLWVQLWREVLGVDYDPIVSVKRVRDLRKNRKHDEPDDLGAALVETVKYSVKSADFCSSASESDSEKMKRLKHELDKKFLYGLTEQIKNLRFIDSGGCFKGIFKKRGKSEDEVSESEMLLKNQSNEQTTGLELVFNWDGKRAYLLHSVSDNPKQRE